MTCRDCKQQRECRVSAFVPYEPVCHECEKARARKSNGMRAMDPNAWPVDGFGVTVTEAAMEEARAGGLPSVRSVDELIAKLDGEEST